MTKAEATEAFGEPRSTSSQELYQAVHLLRKENAEIFERLEVALGSDERNGPMAQRLERLNADTLRELEAFIAELDAASREQGAFSVWVYPHEEATLVSYLGSIILLGIPVLVDDYLEKQEIELLFRGDMLASWTSRVVQHPLERMSQPNTSPGYAYRNPWPSTNTWYPSKPKHEHKSHHPTGHTKPQRPTRSALPTHDHWRGPKNPVEERRPGKTGKQR